MQTSVEWLDNELWKLRLNLRGGEVSIKFYLEQEARLILQAKEMEKEQHKYTWYDSRVNTCIPFEDYYTQTYGCKQNEDLTFKKKSQWTKIDKKQP